MIVLHVVDGESGDGLTEAEAALVHDRSVLARPGPDSDPASIRHASRDGTIELPPIWGVSWARVGAADHEWMLVPLLSSDIGRIQVPLARAGAVEVTIEGDAGAGRKYVEVRRHDDDIDRTVTTLSVDKWPAYLDRLKAGRWQASVLDEDHGQIGAAEFQIAPAQTTRAVIPVSKSTSADAKWTLHASVAIAPEWLWEFARVVVRSSSSSQSRPVRDLEVRKAKPDGALSFDVDLLDSGEYWLWILPFNIRKRFNIMDADASIALDVPAPATLEVAVRDDADGALVTSGSITWTSTDTDLRVVNSFIEAKFSVAKSVFVMQVPGGIKGMLDVDVDGFEVQSDSVPVRVASGRVERREMHLRRASPIMVLVVSNGDPIPNLEVEVVRATDGQVFQVNQTDESGQVRFDGLRPGDWVVRAKQPPGFRPAEEAVALRAGAAAHVKFDLIRSK